MIEFRVEWQDAPGVRDPVLARTWCRLTMDVDGQVVSRAIDHRSQSLRDGINGSALPLCSWMVENWWCLQHEAYRYHRPWRSHEQHGRVNYLDQGLQRRGALRMISMFQGLTRNGIPLAHRARAGDELGGLLVDHALNVVKGGTPRH